MDGKTFLEELTDLMDTETELTMETQLANIEEWDSLSNVAFLAYCTSAGHRNITPKAVKDAKTVQDLYRLASEA